MAQIWDDEEPTRDTVQTIIGMVAVYYAHVGAYNNAVLAQRLSRQPEPPRRARLRDLIALLPLPVRRGSHVLMGGGRVGERVRDAR